MSLKNTDSVSLVRQLCKERGIAISKLEKECGFSNGYIRGLREGKFPADRLKIIADYLDVSFEYLLNGEEKEGYYINSDTAKKAQELFENTGMRILFDAAKDSKPEDLQMAADLLRRLKETNPDG